MAEKELQFLDEDGQVQSGQQLPDLDKEELLTLYRAMLFNRRVDERMTKLQRQGRIGFYVGALGEEASIVGSTFALESQDWVVPCYREAGAAFLRGYPLDDFLCQLYGNSRDPMSGRQMPCHWGSRELRLTSVSSPVGSQIPHAVGLGMAARAQGKDEVALTFFGDGATSEGDFHVSCNFAAVFRAPVIFLCRNNRYAISVPLEAQTVSENIAVKAKAYGMEGVQIDGNDVLAVYSATLAAAKRARSGEGPTLIEALTYRQGAHSTSDDPRAYRSDEEVEEWIRKDPLRRFRKFITAQGLWDETKDDALREEIDREIKQGIEKAESLGPPPIDSVFEDVLDEMPWHLAEQLDSVR